MRHLCGQTVALGLLMAAATGSAADPSWYRRADTWQNSVLLSREALQEVEAERAAASSQLPPPRLGPWYRIGPIVAHAPPSRDDVPALPPDCGVGTSCRPGPQGQTLQWERALELTDGWIYTLSSGPHHIYLFRSIHAVAPTTLTVYFDSLGEAQAWCNGALVLEKRQGRIAYNTITPDARVHPTAVQLDLRAGENHFLVSIGLKPKERSARRSTAWRGSTDETRPWGAVFTGYSTEVGPATAWEALLSGETSQFYFSTSSSLGPVRTAASRAREQLWKLVERDFPGEIARREISQERKDGIWRCDWAPGDLSELGGRYVSAIRDPTSRERAAKLATTLRSHDQLWKLREHYIQCRALEPGEDCLGNPQDRRTLHHQIESLRLAIRDLVETFGEEYPGGIRYLARLAAVEREATEANAGGHVRTYADAWAALQQLRREALLANPLLDFESLLLVKRRANPFLPSLPTNWASNCSLAPTGYDNEIAQLSPVREHGRLQTLYRPDGERFVGDVDLHFDGDRLLFSMPGDNGRWQVFEIRADGTALRQVTRGDQPDVESYDACYLPNGKIIFCSTACFAGVPCVNGSDHVAVLYVMDEDGGNVRQLCFEQDHDWCPTVMNDGRVLYSRWEYTDIPHFFSRLLFTMNPDGTGQRAYYGSNSYWPNAIFYAQPIPGDPSKVIGVVSAHHMSRRSGELVLFDPARGQREAEGVLQRIPGRGEQVEPLIRDRLVAGSWPRFLHPFPLNDKYFLVSCRISETSRWGIYLVDVFDNMLLLREEADHDLLEPIPLRRRPRPPAIAEKVDPNLRDATVTIEDIYAGPGLQGVPPGTVKQLRLIAYHYAYQDMGLNSRAIGVNASWDTVKLVLGTVPVHEDGSAMFRAPANTPITIQPLDAEGKAVQLMRSWLVAMPGETVSCVGCHEPDTVTPPVRDTLAVRRGTSEIAPWYGPARGFGFRREVQPVLDKYCCGCHNGAPQPDGSEIANFADAQSADVGGFSPSYLQLQRFVRRPGPEADYHLLPAGEYHADTSELIQLLEKGHHNVQLDAEAWDRLITWIDLNVPYHGSWNEAQGAERVGQQRQRRRDLRLKYAGIDEDPEEIADLNRCSVDPVVPKPTVASETQLLSWSRWPFDAAEAKRRQQSAGPTTTRSINLGDGVTMELVLVPAGEFVMGDPAGLADERPPSRIRIERSFWMGKCEVTNQQYAQFDPSHDSRYAQTLGITATRGYPLNRPAQPAVRISWTQAMAFCQRLSEATGEDFTLPTEAEWEYACRAGTATPFNFGGLDTDFSGAANMADESVQQLLAWNHRSRTAPIPRDSRFDDGAVLASRVGSYQPNAWGLHDMHGNAAEWTLSSYRQYPYREDNGHNDPHEQTRKVVRGGSWRDCPQNCRSAYRMHYPAWMRIHNVGFRVVSSGPAAEKQVKEPY